MCRRCTLESENTADLCSMVQFFFVDEAARHKQKKKWFRLSSPIAAMITTCTHAYLYTHTQTNKQTNKHIAMPWGDQANTHQLSRKGPLCHFSLSQSYRSHFSPPFPFFWTDRQERNFNQPFCPMVWQLKFVFFVLLDASVEFVKGPESSIFFSQAFPFFQCTAQQTNKKKSNLPSTNHQGWTP